LIIIVLLVSLNNKIHAMNTSDLQNKIIRKILAIKDDRLLNYVNNLITKEEDTSYYKLNDTEKTLIEESLADYEKGNIVSNDEVFSKTKKWLEE
jgi:hypothetical protein